MLMKFNLKFPLARLTILIAWTIALFSYFFQFPFNQLSWLIVPGLAIYLIGILLYKGRLVVDLQWMLIFDVYFAYLTLMIVPSVIQNVEIGTILRFFLILAIIPLFSIARLDEYKWEYMIFIALAVCKCLILLYYAIQLIKTGSFLDLRNWAQTNHYGDIYISPATFLPKVQVHGNGILPMALILNLEYGKKGKISKVVNILLALGTLAAGNSAYLLGIFIYYIYRLYGNLFKKQTPSWIKIASVFMILVAGVVGIAYSVYILNIKAAGSNVVRIEQAKILLDNYIFLGNGLGHRIFYSGVMRSYSGGDYFELQTLYIFNQIGVLGLLLFYYLTIKPIKMIGKREMILFTVYLLYAFFNPYCFDSTEMIVISLLVNYSRYVREQLII